MATYYQAENWTPFEHDYVDDAGEPINISENISITLYLYFPTRTCKTVVGEYVVTATKNRVRAVAKNITNSDLNYYYSNQPVVVEWQFKTVLDALTEPLWSPKDILPMYMNLGMVRG